jgi:hypothetical protein
MGTVSALTPDTAATGPSSVAGAKEDIGQKSVTALESRRAKPQQAAGRHQGNGIAAYDFAPDSLLVTQDGLRPIEQIKLGDWVWAYDETTGVNSLKEVVRTFARDTDWVVILEIGNEVVQATLEHPFWQDGIGWRRAGELTAGDRVQSISGVPATVTHAEHRLAPQPVFNIEVTDAHTYFVSPTKLLVHNACKVYAVKSEVPVYRVFGGDSRAQGFSWTTKDPRSVPNFRDAAGLPSGEASGANNTADFLIQGKVNPADIIKSRPALPLDGNKGGLPELIIDPKNVKLNDFSVLKP